MKWLFSLLVLPLFLCANPFAERLAKAEVGDYIVTEFREIVSLLRVSGIEESRITFEEISVPWHQMRGKKGWKRWAQNGAPGHAHKMRFILDLKTQQMIECYSITRKVYLDTSDSIITQLLTLELKPVDESSRKKKGNGSDPWIPPIIFEGNSKTPNEVLCYSTTLPKGDTPISGKTAQLYFADSLPFPYWMQVEGLAVGSKRIRALDSGKGLVE